jgi:hypothetical protein
VKVEIVRRHGVTVVMESRRQPSDALTEAQEDVVSLGSRKARPEHDDRRVNGRFGRAAVSLEWCGSVAMSRGLS